MKSIFEAIGSTSDGVFGVDGMQRIAFWNDAAQQILGFEADSVLGRFCYEVLGARDGSGCTLCGKRCATFRASLRNKLSPTRDVQANTGAGGTIWISVTTIVLPSRYHDLALLMHVFRDTTKAHRLPLQLEQVLDSTDAGSEAGRLPHPSDHLTEREEEVLRQLASGQSTQSICAKLGIETTTVRTHVQHILTKLGVHSRLEAVACASQNGFFRSAKE